MFLCDLHIHSRFSRATSKALNPAHLDAWARLKGLDVIGTGDFTHPKWRQELRETLKRDENTGLYTLKGKSENLGFVDSNSACLNQNAPLFCLQTEISSIYKKNGRVRKIHNLIYVPSLEDADRFSERLGKIANLASDGRPIIGLDSRNLLELLLDVVPEGILIPAHIWTPWFSLFGSKSGFDTIEECFEDLSPHIFALETGLSSDPPMNRYISALDRYALVSNSDAHSGSNLGREANLFEGQISFDNIFSAIKASAHHTAESDERCRYLGTLEFFPEEGKYHLDGHRMCNLSLNPLETKECNNICPVCGKPLTIGVLHRVMELADRQEPLAPEGSPPFTSLMPLIEITAELLSMGKTSNKVLQSYGHILSDLGSELHVLQRMPISDIRSYWEELGIAIERLRKGEVQLKAGFDGEYGEVRLFQPGELGTAPKKGSRSKKNQNFTKPKENLRSLSLFQNTADPSRTPEKPKEKSFSDDQNQALHAPNGPCLVMAGPGAGKTHLLLGRICSLLENISPKRILAITFTRRAAEEMRERLLKQGIHEIPLIDTLHAFCWSLIQEHFPNAKLLREDEAFRLFCHANPTLSRGNAREAWASLSKKREQCLLSDDHECKENALFLNYKNTLKTLSDDPVFDFTLLLETLCPLLEGKERFFDAVLVDEVQDCSVLNIRLVQRLVGPKGEGLFAIGDPDQSIYGFRGSVTDISHVLKSLYPNLTIFQLGTSYRSSQAILDSAQKLLVHPQCGFLQSAHHVAASLHFCKAHSDIAEARWIAHTIEGLLGSSSHSLNDHVSSQNLAPSDIAILVRYKALIAPIAKALRNRGIPTSIPTEAAFWEDPEVLELLELCDPNGVKNDPAFPFDKKNLPNLSEIAAWKDAQHPDALLPSQSSAFQQMMKMWQQCGSWERFYEKLLFAREDEMIQRKAESVQILTLHASKGLEFAAVFIPALEDGILPSHDIFKKQEADLEEERRLFYVGMTRASERLYLSCAQKRTIYGQSHTLSVSDFYLAIQEFFKKSEIVKKTKEYHKEISFF